MFYKIGFHGLISISPENSFPGSIAKITEGMKIRQALAGAAIGSVLLGVTNCLLILPFDGGRIFKALLRKMKAPELLVDCLTVIPAIVVVLFMIMALFGDMIGTVRWLLK